MYHKHRLSIFLSLVIPLMFASCQSAATPVPTVIPSPTKTLIPTATFTPTVTPTLTPTATPKPQCGTPEPAATEILQHNTSETFTRFEPPDGQAYFGFTFRLWEADASEGDTRPLAERICDSIEVELGGKTPTIMTVWIQWKSPTGLQPFSAVLPDIKKIQEVLGTTVVPNLAWQPGNNNQDDVTTKDIASGKYDDYIRQYAQDVKSYGAPLFIRLICGEFNGNWWKWCSPKANPDLTIKDFVDSWRRVVDIFREEGVTNVAWVWTPADFPPSEPGGWGRDPNWQAYYPGDEYVDWVGSDTYDYAKVGWFEPIYQFGVEHNKPFFLAEFGMRWQGTNLTTNQHINWLNDMFDYFESHPKIKAILYFNYNISAYDAIDPSKFVFLYDGQVNYLKNVNDGDIRLIAGGPEIRTLFANRIANPRYVSTIVIEP